MEYLILIVVLLVLALILFKYFLNRRQRGKWTSSDRKFFDENWRKITSTADLKHRVMDADKLLEHFMRKMGWTGSFGDMLKSHGSKFSDLNGLWSAHKLRNSIAHELNKSIGAVEADVAIKAFRRAFKDLGL